MSIAKAKVGDIFSSKFCGYFVVLSYINSANVRIRFLDTGYETVTRSCQVKNGQEWDSDHLEQGDFDYSVFFDSESARVYANDPYIYGKCLLTIKIFEMED